ncbi:MAG: DUF86 domain-containing protein [bacterium]|nr:DUF86 domain-containing protein [Acidimicrobiia bacterium]MCY4650167.1 DUF86 domain-containing protein [bacterium]
MTERDENLVFDILDAASHLALLVEDGPHRFHEEWLFRRAAERLLEIIGVAASNLSDEFLADNPVIQIKSAKRMRDFLAHQYQKVDYSVVWETISVSVPDFVADFANVQ